MKAAEVRLIHVQKSFGTVEAVKDVTLTISRGQFFTLLGPSGCGKTTVLRMIAGFTLPDQGKILFDGKEVNDIPPWKREVGMVFQNYALWPHMTVFENVAFGLKERNLPKSVIQEKTYNVLELVNLAGLEKRRPSELSGGQQQRVALARTLVIEPKLLLLDEPLSNLDAKLRVQMRHELVRLQKELGLTTLYVTHDQEEALILSTQIAVMAKGRVVQVGTPKDIYETPESREVADFVGTSNFFIGNVLNVKGEKIQIETEEKFLFTVERSKEVPLQVGSKVLLNLRPESIQISYPREALPAVNRMDGIVRTSAYLGSLVQYEIEVTGGKKVKVNVTNLRKRAIFTEGERVFLSFESEDMVPIPLKE